MKKTIFLVLFTICAAGFSAQAQNMERYSSARLDDLSGELKRQTVDLVDRTDEDLRRGNPSRREIEAAFLARQLDSSAGLFDEMVRDRRRANDLREAASILTELARRSPNLGSNNALWRDVQNSINDINRELGRNQGGGGNNNGGGNNDGPISGRAYWRGTVDDVVQLEIRGRDVNARNVSGRFYNNGTFSFTAALPTRNVTVGVNKRSGRGTVEVIQQPRRDNDYTAIIEIRDRDGGARDYQLEIFWQ